MSSVPSSLTQKCLPMASLTQYWATLGCRLLYRSTSMDAAELWISSDTIRGETLAPSCFATGDATCRPDSRELSHSPGAASAPAAT